MSNVRFSEDYKIEHYGNSNFQNFMFDTCLEFLTVDKVQKASDSGCYTASSEPFGLYLTIYAGIVHFITSPTSGCISVDIVRLRTQATEFFICFIKSILKKLLSATLARRKYICPESRLALE
jgi:hypothetical protein